ncbi:MAG: hypothetical protein ACRYG7_32350 [Janthinobacterium lividum]
MPYPLQNVASETRLALAALLLAALPLAANAQTTATQPRAGDLVGSRPRAASSTQAARATANADAGLSQLIHESVDLNRATAAELPDLYGRFIDATREQRRQWTNQDWDNASATLSRLNARYADVRTDIDMEDRLRIRSWQGEFRTLQGARRVNQKLDEKNVNIK